MPAEWIDIKLSKDGGKTWQDTSVLSTSLVGNMVKAGGRWTDKLDAWLYEWPGFYQVEGGS